MGFAHGSFGGLQDVYMALRLFAFGFVGVVGGWLAGHCESATSMVIHHKTHKRNQNRTRVHALTNHCF